MVLRKVLQVSLAAILATASASTVFAQADNSNSKVAAASSFSGWMSDYSKANEGRVSREAYMNESGRRWDAMDQNNQGLTTDQVNGLYGYQGSSTTVSNRDPMSNDGISNGTMHNGAMPNSVNRGSTKK